MTTQKYINENESATLKKGDKVVMHTCIEADCHKGKIWTCFTNSFKSQSGSDVVFLEDFSGYFLTEFLKKI